MSVFYREPFKRILMVRNPFKRTPKAPYSHDTPYLLDLTSNQPIASTCGGIEYTAVVMRPFSGRTWFILRVHLP